MLAPDAAVLGLAELLLDDDAEEESEEEELDVLDSEDEELDDEPFELEPLAARLSVR